MGELIRREAASAPLPFSGERLTAALSGRQVEIEHYHRYLLARDFCRDRDVLDVASGEGYGTALLAQVARSAVGIEIDPAVVVAARAEFARPNLRYEQGDARALPLPDASVDVVVSFETLEHILEQEVFIGEVRRVLRPGGLLVMSTPDRDQYSPAGVPPNPFHVLELTRAEFEALLRRRFAHATVAVQRAVFGSVTVGAAPGAGLRVFERRGDTHIEASDHMPRAPYVVALASDGALPPLPDSVYIHRGELDADLDLRIRMEGRLCAVEAEKAAAEVRKATAETERDRAHAERDRAEAGKAGAEARRARAEAARVVAAQRVADLERRLAAAARERAACDDAHRAALGQRDEEIANLEARASQAEERLQAAFRSTSWRLTAPLRSVGSLNPAFARYGRRALKLVWWSVTLQIHRRYWAWHGARRTRVESGGQSPPGPGETPAPRGYPLADRWYDKETPEVSIIILSYNNPGLTLACLESVWGLTAEIRYEIIVVDNGSAPDEYARLRQAGGERHLLRLGSNRYFGEGNNIAVERARGEFICLLNNDTIVTDGWLAGLVAALHTDARVGAVGPKLVFPDGRLQEAGALLMPDATVRQIGKGGNPADPEYNVAKAVHYGSAACLVMPRRLFLEVGGFDLVYEPAYYEDVDLCFKIQERGKTIQYCPSVTIVHHEGMSHREVPGIASLIEINRRTFVNRWRERLARPAPAARDVAISATKDNARRRSVVIYMTYGLMLGGGERFLLTLADHLAATWDVSVATAQPYSRTRLLNIADMFDLDLSRVALTTVNDVDAPGDCDVLIAIGNELVPPLLVRSGLGIYVCQFPFPAGEAYIGERLRWLESYARVVVYSEFVRDNYVRQARERDAPMVPVSVVSPPVEEGRSIAIPAGGRLNRVLSIGRFFADGHCKRQDLLIEAFRTLCVTCSVRLELHLVGGVHIGAENQAYLARCQALAQDLPVFFHLNADRIKVSDLLGSSSIYWHGAGLEVDEAAMPWALEHFGISIREAMNAGCIAMAPNRGGPREIIEDGITGYLFEDAVELVDLTRAVFERRHPEAVQEMRRRAVESGGRFSRDVFCGRWDQILRELAEAPSRGQAVAGSLVT